jgi:hypothetical protein
LRDPKERAMAELGKKHECAECGTKFYDLGKADATCPKCGAKASVGQRESERRTSVEPRARYVAPAPADEVEEEAGGEDIADDEEEILAVEGDEEEEEEDDEDEG